MEEKTPPMAHHCSADSDDQIQPQALELKKPQQPKDYIIMEQEQENESDKDDTQTQTPSSASKTPLSNNMENALQGLVLPPAVDVTEKSVEPEAMADDSGCERLKKHRVEVAGKVWIPDIWGQEEQLKDWIDCTTAFDAPLVPSRIMTARTALVEEGARASTGGGLTGVEFSFL